MIKVPEVAGTHVAVFGLGASGVATALALKASGAHVHAWDDSEESRAKAEALGTPLDDLNARDWALFDTLVLAPGVPLTHPRPHRMVELARATDTRVVGDIELFARAVAAAPDHLKPKVIGITGTNGKSTTTALIGHILAASGRDAQVGGNIGTPALALAPFHSGAVYVLELSSFQLETTNTLKPDVSVLLNITPDHIDRHGSFDAYAAAKARLFKRQGAGDTAVIAVDDDASRKIASALKAGKGPTVVPVSASRALSEGVHAVGGILFDALDGAAREVADLRTARVLMGRHNWQNAAAAYAAARTLDVEPRRAVQALQNFPGLPHRMEEIARVGPVTFINDSKATNAASARQALGAFENVFWIAGGRAKGASGVDDMFPLMPRVAKAYLIGEAAETFAAQLKGRAVVEISRNLKAAVAAAARDAAASSRPDPVVLLAPACASFDQFADYAARGDAFRDLVLALPGAAASQAAE